MSSLIDSLLRSATAQLVQAGIVSARADAELLLASAQDSSRGEVLRLAMLGRTLEDDAASAYLDLVAQRAQRVPLQHLTGYADFAGVRLAVGPGVFTPRPETEVLVARAYDVALAHDHAVIVDLCTGSGAIAAALKQRVPTADLHAVELSAHAHGWAQHNFAQLGLDVDLRLGDGQAAFGDLEGQVDLVTCNPPYIPNGAVPVDPEVRLHDPSVALYGDSEDGLKLPAAMAARAATLLRPGGVLLMEHSHTQGEDLGALLRGSRSWSGVRDFRDWAHRPRVIEAVRV
ncbi:MAG: peptide chain release factor N(5)-glutamine methyltransferase [Ornithinimicrobium sp.]